MPFIFGNVRTQQAPSQRSQQKNLLYQRRYANEQATSRITEEERNRIKNETYQQRYKNEQIVKSEQNNRPSQIKTSSPTSLALANIYNTASYDQAKAQQMYNVFSFLQSDPTSEYYNAYSTPSNKAVGYLSSLGIDTSNIDEAWFNRYSYLDGYLRYDGTTNTPSKPSQKSPLEEKQAYWYYQIKKSDEATVKAENQWNNLQKELTYWAQQSDRNLSDDEIIQKIDWSKYDELLSMEKNAAINQPNEYNRAIGYSRDALYGVLWQARNPEYQGDMYGAMAYSALGMGNQWQDNPEITARLNAGNKDTYSPYSVGSTMDKERAYFGVSSFNQKWIDDHYSEIMGGNNEQAKKYFANVIKANEYTQNLKQQLSDMNAKIDEYINSGVCDYDWIANMLRNDSQFKDLFDLDDTLKLGDQGLKNITEAVDFRWKDKEAEIRDRCNKRFAENIANGAASLVNTILGISNVAGTIGGAILDAIEDMDKSWIKMPEPRPEAQPGPAPTGIQPTETPRPDATPTPTPGITTPDVNTPSPTNEPQSTPAPQQYQDPMLSVPEQKLEQASIEDLNDVASTIYSAGTQAEKTALLTGNTSYQDACIERLKTRATDTIKGYTEGSADRANKTYYNSYSVTSSYENVQKSITDKQEELELYTKERDELNEIRSQDEATAEMDPEEYATLVEFKESSDNATWNIVKHELQLGPGEPDPYDDSNDRTLGYTQALKSLYRIVTATDPNELPEDEVLEKAKLWWGYISRQNESPISRLVFEANRNGDDTDELEFEEGNMLIRLEKGDNGQFAFSGAKNLDTGEVYGADWQSQVDRMLGYTKLGADEIARLGELDRRMDTLEQEIYEGQEYLSHNNADYMKAKQDRDFTRVIYNEACNIAAASGKEMDRYALDKIEAIESIGNQKTEKEYAAQTYYDYQVSSGSISRESAAELATKDRDTLGERYRTLSDMFTYLNNIGVQFDDESRKNVTDYLGTLNGHSIDASYVALDANPDFQSVVDLAVKDAADGKYGVFGQAVAEYLESGDNKRLSLLAERGWGDVDVISEEECRRWLYMSGTDDGESAKNYLRRLSDPDDGALTVRKMLNIKQEAYEYASQPGLNAYVATAGGIAAKLFSWPASMLYRAIEGGIFGKEVSPYNRALRGQAYAESSLAGVKDAIVKSSKQLFGDNSFLEQALAKTYDIGVGAAQMAVGSAAVSEVFSLLGTPLEAFASSLTGSTPLSVKILTSAAEVVPTTLESAESTYWKTLQKTNSLDKAELMYHVSLVTGLITHSVVMNGMHNAVQADPNAVSSGIAGLIERVVKTDASVGASTLTSSTITKLADKAIMKADSQWNENFEYYRSQGYPKAAAEQMADQDMWQSVLNETMDSIVNATIRTVAMAGVNYAGTKIEQGIKNLKSTWADVQKFMKQEFAPDTKHWAQDDNGNAIALEDISPELFEKRPSGYNTATRTIVDTDGNFVSKVPDDMVDSKYGETSMINRETGEMFTAIGYVYRDGEVDFVTSQGQLVPFENVGTNFNNYETPNTAGYDIQREYALMDEAYQYASGVAARDYYNAQMSQMADAAEDEYFDGQQTGSTYQSSSSLLGLPSDTWGTPMSPDQAKSLSKDLETVNASYGATPTASATGFASVLSTGDKKVDKAASQVIVGALANGDSKTAAMVISQVLSKTEYPDIAKAAIASAALTQGMGNATLISLFNKAKNGEQITSADVTTLIQGVNKDRKLDPKGFDAALRAKTKELAVAGKTNRAVANRKGEIKGKQKAVKSATSTLTDKKQEQENANASLEVAKQTASKNIKALSTNKKKEDNGPVEQSLNQVKGADALARQKDAEVAVQERKVEEAQSDLQDTQNQIETEAREEAIVEVNQEEQQEQEQSYNNGIAIVQPRISFGHTVRVYDTEGRPVDLTGIYDRVEYGNPTVVHERRVNIDQRTGDAVDDFYQRIDYGMPGVTMVYTTADGRLVTESTAEEDSEGNLIRRYGSVDTTGDPTVTTAADAYLDGADNLSGSDIEHPSIAPAVYFPSSFPVEVNGEQVQMIGLVGKTTIGGWETPVILGLDGKLYVGEDIDVPFDYVDIVEGMFEEAQHTLPEMNDVPRITEVDVNATEAKVGTPGITVPGADGAGNNNGELPSVPGQNVGLGDNGNAGSDGGQGSDAGTAVGTAEPVRPGVRGDSQRLLNKQTTKALKEKGVTDLKYGLTDSQRFSSDLANGRASNPHGLFVDAQSPEELEEKGAIMILAKNGLAGAAVQTKGENAGNIFAVFKSGRSRAKRASVPALIDAIAQGGDRLDCYDGGLRNIYASVGFEPVARVKFNRDFAPDGWNYERDGEPDIVFWKLKDGETAESVAAKYDPRKFHHYTDDEIAALPLFDDVTDENGETQYGYDRAEAYRNRLISIVKNNPSSYVKPRPGHTPEQLDKIESYLGAVNKDVLEAAIAYRADPNAKFKRISIVPVSDREAGDIKRLTGADVTGYKHDIDKNFFNHVNERHGENGKADNTMADVNDIARVGWVIENYDNMTLLESSSSGYMDGKDTPMPIIRYEKSIDGMIYVTEAVGENGWNKLHLVSAYMTSKNPAENTQGDADSGVVGAEPQPNVQNAHLSSADTSVADTGNAVNQGETTPAPVKQMTLNMGPFEREIVNGEPNGTYGMYAIINGMGLTATMEGDAPRPYEITDFGGRRFGSSWTADGKDYIELDPGYDTETTRAMLKDAGFEQEDPSREYEWSFDRTKLPSKANTPTDVNTQQSEPQTTPTDVNQTTPQGADGQAPITPVVVNGPQRQFGSRTAQESNALHKEVKQHLLANSAYDPDTNEEQIDRAITWVESHATEHDPDGFWGAFAEATSEEFNKLSVDGQARVLSLVSMAAQKGLTAAETQLADLFNTSGTDLGQALQARKIFRLMTPAGRKSALEKEAERIQQEYSMRGKKGLKLTVSKETLDAAANAKSAEEFEAARKQMERELAAQIPSDWRLRARTFRMASMLANPRTHIRNLEGNFVMRAPVAIKNAIGTALEKIVRVPAGERTKAIRKTPESIAYAKRKAIELKDVLQGSAKYFEVSAVEANRQAFGKGEGKTALGRFISRTLGRGIQKVADKNSEFLETEDWWSLNPHFVTALASYMTANGYTEADMKGEVEKKGIAYAVNEAQKATYRDFNQTARWLSNQSNKPAWLQFGINAIVPFTKTPMNIVRRGAEYSPFGLAYSLATARHQLNAYKEWEEGGFKDKKPKDAKSPGEVFDSIAAGLTGTMLAGVGVLLSQLGILKVNPTEGEKRNKVQEYSLNFELFGHKLSFGIGNMVPTMLPVLLGGSVSEEVTKLKEGDADVGNILQAIGNMFQPTIETTMFMSMNNLLETSKYTQYGDLTASVLVQKVLANYASSFIPSIIGATAHVVDPTQRKAYVKSGDSMSVWTALVEQAENKIPFLSTNNVPYLNEWGEEKTNSRLTAFLENFILPDKIQEVEDDELDYLLDNLSTTTGHDVNPNTKAKTLSINGQSIKLEDKQWHQYHSTRLQMAKDRLQNLVETPEFVALCNEPDVQVKLIQNVWEYVNNVTAKEMFPNKKVDSWIEEARTADANGELSDYIFSRAEGQAKKASNTAHRKSLTESISQNNIDAALVDVDALRMAGVEDSSIRSTLTKNVKPLYKEAYKSGNYNEAIRIQDMLMALDIGYDYDDFTSWIK